MRASNRRARLRDRLREHLADTRHIFDMHRTVRTPLLHRFQRLAAVCNELVVDDVDFAGRRQDRDQAWNGVHDQARLALAFAQRLFGALALVDIRQQVVPTDDVPADVTERKAT